MHDWSGIERKLAPMIEPDGSFVVRFTPPRTGTFMYHTHLHDERQLPLGLYGPMLVVDDDQAYDPAIDHVVMVGRSGVDPAAPNVLVPATPLVINGETAPVFVWKAGERHRVRLINITPDDIVSVSLQNAQGPAHVDAGGEGRRAAARRTSRARSPRGRRSPSARPTTSRSTCRPDGERCGSRCEAPPGKWEAQGQVIAK